MNTNYHLKSQYNSNKKITAKYLQIRDSNLSKDSLDFFVHNGLKGIWDSTPPH